MPLFEVSRQGKDCVSITHTSNKPTSYVVLRSHLRCIRSRVDCRGIGPFVFILQLHARSESLCGVTLRVGAVPTLPTSCSCFIPIQLLCYVASIKDSLSPSLCLHPVVGRVLKSAISSIHCAFTKFHPVQSMMLLIHFLLLRDLSLSLLSSTVCSSKPS